MRYDALKIPSETRWILFLLLLFGSASVISSVWVFHEREKTRHIFEEKEESLLETISSLKEELAKVKAMGTTLEEKMQELSNTLNRKGREVEEFKAKYEIAFRDKKSLEKKWMQTREEKLALEGKLKQFQSSPFLAKLLTEKKTFDQDVEGLKKTIEDSRGELVSITDQRNTLEAHLEEIQTAKVKIEEKLRQEQSKMEAMAGSLEKEKAGRISVTESLSENYARIKREKETLESKLSHVSQEKGGMETELTEVRGRLQEINEKRDQLATQVKEINQVLETRLGEIEQIRSVYEKTIEESRQIARVEKDVVELPPIIVKGESSETVREAAPRAAAVPEAVSKPVQNGKVTNVNDKFHFVVIDLGKEQGVRDGMLFHVYREGQDIGVIRVIEARQQISACDVVKKESPTALFHEGDLVIQ